MKTDTEREGMRQQSVANIFRAVGMVSQAELASATADKIRHPERAHMYAMALEKFKKSKSPDEIANLKARTKQAEKAGELSAARTKEVNKLLDEKEQAAKLGNEILEKEKDEYLSVLFPGAGGEKIEAQMKATDLAKLMAKDAGVKSDLPERKFLTAQEQQAVAIEEVIMNEGVAGEGPESPAAHAQYRDFNRYSNRPYVMLNVNGKIVPFNLPKIGGKILRAKDVHKLAEKADMSVENYVIKILRHEEAAGAFGIRIGESAGRLEPRAMPMTPEEIGNAMFR